MTRAAAVIGSLVYAGGLLIGDGPYSFAMAMCGLVVATAAVTWRWRQEEKAERARVEGIMQFADKLKSGDPIKATRVERFDTPDGPMHVRTKVVLFGEEGDRDA